MKSKRLMRDAVVLGIFMVGGLVVNADLLRRSLETESRLAVKRLEETAGALIQKAHHAKDDLALQETVQALAQAPGISMVCVVDPHGIILSHSHLSQLGKVYHRAQTAGEVTSKPLWDDQTKWGVLIFSISDESWERIWFQQALIETIACSFLWVGFVGWSFVWGKRVDHAQAAICEREALLEEEKNRVARLDHDFRENQSLWTKRLQSAVDRIPQVMILLDHRQRVVAANLYATQWLGVDDVASLAGKSWQEIPLLQGCGSALERSLAAPGQSIDWLCSESKVTLRFETDADRLAGTWINFPLTL